MMTWTIPLVMSNLNNNPTNQYGLVGVVTLSGPPYSGNVVFTKPGTNFPNRQFALQNIQYPAGAPYPGQLYFEIGGDETGTTPIRFAQEFTAQGQYNPEGNNPPPVNTAGLPPVFSFHAPWDGQSNLISNGQARLPRRLLAALGQGNSGWQQVLFDTNGGYTGGGPNLTVYGEQVTPGSPMLYLATGQYVTFQINLTPVTGVVIIVNMQSTAVGGQITVSASTNSSPTVTTIGSYTPSVGQYGIQAFFIPSTNFQTGNNLINVKNTGPTNVYFQKATFAW
jgi:hypothetical protein